MRPVMIAALLAAHLSAVESPAQAAELPSAGSAVDQGDSDDPGRSGLGEGLRINPSGGAEPALGAAAAPMAAAAAAAAQEEEPRKKRKSTGDKVLTGAAVILGVGALAVGGLLVAIFVN